MWSLYVRCGIALMFVLAWLPAGLVIQLAGAQQASTLDGMNFSGEFIPAGKTSGRPDEFIFANGAFHSRECLSLGFAPGPYTLQMKDDRLHFRSRLTSDDNGVMTYEGVVMNGLISARINWVKPRWYWTMRRDFQFEGKLSGEVADANK